MSITKLGKKLLCFMAIFTMVFALFACHNDNNDTKSDKAEKEAAAKETIKKQALNKIFWDPSATSDITSDLQLASEVNGYKITWTSNVPDVIGTDGVVNLPAVDHEKAEAVLVVGSEEVDYYRVPVTLTATATLEYEYTDKDGNTQKATASETNEYKFTVLCFDGDFDTIAAVKANAYQYIYEENGVEKALVTNYDVTYSVGFYGVVTAKLNASGSGQFMVHDGTAGIYVYKNADVEVGDTVYVTGDIYSYYGSLQVGSNISVKVVSDRDIKVAEYTEKTIDAWEQERAGDNLQNVIGYLGGDRYKLYAKVVEEKNEQTSDAYKLEDPYTGEVAWVYYKSYNAEQEEVLKSYVGKYVYITGVTYDRDSRISKNHLLWDGGIEEASAPTLTDDQKLEIAKKAVEALAGSYASYSKFTLPTENTEVGATITWTVPTDAPYADGAFLGVDVDTKTTFVATIKVGELTEEVEIEITVKKLNVLTIDEVVKLEIGDVVKLSGTIDVVFSSNNNYFLKDATGRILVYVKAPSGITVDGETKTIKAGDKVEFIGTYNVFNGTPQIGSILKYTSYEAGEWTMSVPIETTIAALKEATSENAPYGQYLMVSGVIVKSGNYYYLAESTDADAKMISLFNSNVPEKVSALADTDTKATLFVYYYGNAKSDYSGDTRVIFNGREGEYFVGDETVVLPEPSVDTVMTELKEGVAYNYAVIQKNVNNAKLHLTGAMSGYYLATSEHGYEAAKLYVQKVEGGYYLYFLNGETKTYISLIYRDNSGKDSNTIVVSTDTPTTVWTWNEELSTLVTTIPNQANEGTTTYYLGTYNTFTTISASNVSYASTSFVGHFYPASKEVAPEPVVKEEIKTDFDVKSYEELAELVPNADDFTTDKYYVAGYVKSVDNATYGNMYIEDTKGNTWYVYGLYNVDGTVLYGSMTSDKPVVGDAVVIYGILSNYNGTKQTKNGWLVQLGDKVLEAEEPEPDPDPTPTPVAKVEYTFNGSMPEGLTYISNNPSYPTPAFYKDGGLKINYENMGVSTATFASQSKVSVVLVINTLNDNSKTAAASEDVFTVYGLNAAGETVATATLKTIVVGENTVELTGEGIVSVKVVMTGYPVSTSGAFANVSLGGVKVEFTQDGGSETPDPEPDPDPTPTPVAKVEYTFNGSMPEGLTYISNNPSYPTPAFYKDGGLKINYENMGVSTATFASQSKVSVVLVINTLNDNSKTAAASEDVFTVYGLNAAGETVATATLKTIVVGENTVELTGEGIVSVKVVMTGYPVSTSGAFANVSLGGVKVEF